jgi:predicted MFS family arabinose efflux permease
MNDLNQFIPLFLSGGWVVLVIGAAGMLARIATSKDPEDKNPVHIIKNILAAMTASLVSWFILEQFEVASMYKAIAYGLVGLNSPELLTGIIKLTTGFAEDPTNFIKNIKSGGKPTKKPTKRITKKPTKSKPRVKK